MRSSSVPRHPRSPRSTPPRGRRQKPTGRKPLPQHLKAEEHELLPDSCAACGGHALDVADVLDEAKLHVVKEHQRRRVVRRYTCRCRACGERTTLRSLPAVRSLQSHVRVARVVRVSELLAAHPARSHSPRSRRARHPLAMSTLVSFIERAADLLSGIDGLHWRQLLASSWMATDGTGIKVIVPSLPAAHNGYLELYRNDELAVFQYEPTKERNRRVKASPVSRHAHCRRRTPLQRGVRFRSRHRSWLQRARAPQVP